MNDPRTAFFKASQWKNAYSQTGTDIPTFSQGAGGADVAGTGIQPQGFDYNWQSPEYLAGLSFDINKGTGALGRRSGEQLLRLQQGSGDMQNQQLLEELERRNIRPTGVSLPPV